MSAEPPPSPYATPRAGSAPEAPAQPSLFRIVIGLGLLITSLALAALSFGLALEVGDDPSLWFSVAVLAASASGGVVSGWRMGGGGPAGLAWLTLPIGALVALAIVIK